MNAIIKIISKIFTPVNDLLNNIDSKTAETIKVSFYFFIFVLALGGAYFGYTKGTDSAKIKSPPLAEITNEVFDIDMSRERGTRSFNSILDRDLINEMKNIKLEKNRYPSRESMETYIDKGIVEPAGDEKIKTSQDISINDRIIEGEYKPKSISSPDVKPLDAEKESRKVKADKILLDEKTEIIGKEKTTVKKLDRGRLIRKDESVKPEPIIKDKGIIKN